MPEGSIEVKRIVVKIGSSLITANGYGLDKAAIANWCRQIAHLHSKGIEVVVVSSGAIAAALEPLGLTSRPQFLDQLQACAAVGQMGITRAYQDAFNQYQVTSAQVLLTHQDLMQRKRYLNARDTLYCLLGWKVVPVINENDSVVNDEIKFGDNDTLAALVANLVEADLLIILTDQEGLFDSDPRQNSDAQIIAHGTAGDERLLALAGGSGILGRGGMRTKLTAAKRAAQSGADTVIARGSRPDVLLSIINNDAVGTRLTASTSPISARQQWLAGHLHTNGAIELDDGAVKKVCFEGKSLLPVGVLTVSGDFYRGSVIRCLDKKGITVAHGVSNYSSVEIQRIKGLKSSQIAQLEGFAKAAALIHQNNLVVLTRKFSVPKSISSSHL